MNAHVLDLPDGAFDVTGSQFGVMLVPDQPRALREMVRVTKPGGRVLMIAYGDPTMIDFLGFFFGALRVVVPEFEGLPDDPPPLEFQAADPEELRRRMLDAGCTDVTVERASEELVRSGQELWDWCLGSNPIAGMLLADLTDEQKTTLRQVLDGMLRERSGGNRPAVLTGPVNIAIGTTSGDSITARR